MYKSLLYRELYLSRKFYISGIAGQVGVTLLAYLVRLSMQIGNLSHMAAEELSNVDVLTLILFVLFLPIVYYITIGDNGVHISDVQSKFQLFNYTLPVTPLQQTTVKYIIKLCCFGIASLFSCGAVLLLKATENAATGIGDLTADDVTPVVFVVAIAAVLLDTYKTPLILRCRTMKECTRVSAFAMLPVMIVYLGVGFLMVTWMNAYMAEHPDDVSGFVNMLEEKALAFSAYLPPLTPVIILVLYGIGFFLSYLVIKRREK